MAHISKPPPGSQGHRHTVPPLVGQSTPIEHVHELIRTLAGRLCTVLIEGESGTGKELVASHIHAAGPRADRPFVPVDCTALRDTLFESQLFGHVKGAFTGAEHATLGFIRAADGGTLFLDEVGELQPHVQAKLLRCIQERAVVPLGGVDPIPVNVRIIAASHRDLAEMVQRGEFREDLFYRLNVIRLQVPPLRERAGDISALAQYFLDRQADLYGEPRQSLPPDVGAALRSHDWPGNVRELANVVERAYVLSDGAPIKPDHLPEDFRGVPACPSTAEDTVVPLETAERALIERALRAADGRQAHAARMLNIERRRMYRKVRRYGLQALLAQ